VRVYILKAGFKKTHAGTTIYLSIKKIEPAIQTMRKRLNESTFFAHFENLIDKLNEHKKKK